MAGFGEGMRKGKRWKKKEEGWKMNSECERRRGRKEKRGALPGPLLITYSVILFIKSFSRRAFTTVSCVAAL